MPTQAPRNQGAKGNPASHRMSNPIRKARRARNWEAQQKRKTVRINEAKKREVVNKALKSDGEFTAWEQAKYERDAKRVPKQIAYEKAHREESYAE